MTRIVLLACLVLSTAAHALPLRWDFAAHWDDGAAVKGWLAIDDHTQALVDWSVMSGGGLLPPFTYNSTNTVGGWGSVFPFANGVTLQNASRGVTFLVANLTIDARCAPGCDPLLLPWNAGDILALRLGTELPRSFDYGGYVSEGPLRGETPEPGTLLLVATSALGLIWRRLKVES